MLWWVYLAFSMPLAVFMFFRQNRPGRLGGPISISKALWLYWTISVWFFLIPLALTSGDWPYACWWGWGFLSASFWLRGVLEIYMLFISKNWTPKIGISHDLLTLAGVIISYGLFWRSLYFAAWWIQLFSLGLVISLCIETWYAWAFLQLVRERTKGKEGIWYATKDDPKFLFILKVTTFFNTLLYAVTITFIGQWL
ncbi:MAG: hypothetical protein K2P81_14340 [Bacteriovoracaceae bacterium]|nr:hypothetical protein [Bacteriovoracaceae bacterium]